MADPTSTLEPRIPLLSPVQRLQVLLAKTVGAQQYVSNNAGIALSLAVQLQPESSRENWARAYLEVVGLIHEAKTYAEARVDNFGTSPHARTFSELEGLFASITLEASWAGYSQQLNHLATIALPFVAHATDGATDPLSIDPASLAEIRADLDRLLDRTLKSPFPADFKAQFANSLRTLQDVIIRFEIHGAQGVARATAVVVGTLTVHERAASTDRGVVKDTADAITKVQDVFLKAYAIGQIASQALRALLPGQ